ncbi:hypothetical protein EXIGLDRAFT_835742 [Exidia glandulosa HHB12029]|uniref:Uncharacterized protein n=1 Tax=Exidia glandulosa HHB12029 TaxID=1314781 RepID=A0A165IIH1_EXIGL|nr:hypothetical protein EXIGLDRAFT_835742 [Exidia glandulosa HHB12029]
MASFRTWDNVAYPYVSPQGSSFSSSLPSRNPKAIADTSSPAYQNFAQSFRQTFNHKRGLNEAWMTMSDEERRAWASPGGPQQSRGHYRSHVYDASQKSATPPPSGSYYRADKGQGGNDGRSMTPSQRARPQQPAHYSWRIHTEANFAPRPSSSENSPQEEADDASASSAYPVQPSADFSVAPSYPSSPERYLGAHQTHSGVQQSGAFMAHVPAYAPLPRSASVPAVHAPIPVRAPAYAPQAHAHPGVSSPLSDWSSYAPAQSLQMPQVVPHAPHGYEQAGVSATYQQSPAPDVGWQYQAYPSAGHSGYI